MAAVMISRPISSFWGLEEAVVMVKAPKRIRRVAMPPAMARPKRTSEAAKPELSVGMQPMAVQTPSQLAHWPESGPAWAQSSKVMGVSDVVGGGSTVGSVQI